MPLSTERMVKYMANSAAKNISSEDSQTIVPTLTRLGLAYKIVFNSMDYHARLGAVEAGVGITSIPASKVPPSLVRAEESYLPALPSAKALLCARLGLESPIASEVMRKLSALFFKSDREPG